MSFVVELNDPSTYDFIEWDGKQININEDKVHLLFPNVRCRGKSKFDTLSVPLDTTDEMDRLVRHLERLTGLKFETPYKLHGDKVYYNPKIDVVCGKPNVAVFVNNEEANCPEDESFLCDLIVSLRVYTKEVSPLSSPRSGGSKKNYLVSTVEEISIKNEKKKRLSIKRKGN